MQDTSIPPISVRITQAESKRVVAIIAHMRQIIRTVVTAENRVVRPIHVDHAEALLAAASLRALLFDDSPAPMLLTFLKQHQARFPVETLETDSSMLLLSEIQTPRALHTSDMFADILLNPNTKAQFVLDEPHPFVCIVKDGDAKIAEVGMRQKEWAPGPDAKNLENVSLGYQLGTGICQYAQVTTKIVDVVEWGKVRIGFLKNKPIQRRNIACYVANKLGGVHYDSSRLPRSKVDADEFRTLATAYDWDNQAITHAGNVAVALMCIELVHMEWFIDLRNQLDDFHDKRQDRLIKGLPISRDSDPT